MKITNSINRSVLVLLTVLLILVLGCKKTEISNIDEGLAKEDQVIENLQTKADKRQAELDKMEKERREKAGDLVAKETEKRNEAIKKYEEFLGKYPISPYTPDILISLGELYFERSEEDHIIILDEWERRMEEDETGTFDEPEPMPHYVQTIEKYQTITLKYQDNPYADVAFYGLGYCLWSQGEWEEAKEVFDKLTMNYPDSRFVPEAYFRIGEYYFGSDDRDLELAVKYYGMVPPDNLDFYDKALYKMGWAYYLMGDIGISSNEYRKSIEAFTTLIEVSEGKSVLTDEAMEFTAISLTEWSSDPDESISVNKALDNYSGVFGDIDNKAYSADILHELGDVFLFRQDKLAGASEVYETVLTRYPDYDRAPEVMDSLVECYLREENYDNAHKTRIRIVDGFGPNSAWYTRNEDPDVRNEAIKRWEENLYNVATYYNTQGEKDNDGESFNNAINRYNEYLEAFPVNTKSYHVNFFLAESYYAIEDFNKAGEQYHKTALGYTDEERYEIIKWDEKFTREDALFAAVASYDTVFLAKEKEVVNKRIEDHIPVDKVESLPAPADGVYIEAKGPVEPTTESLMAEDAKLIRACNVFVDKYPQSKDIALVLSKRGEVYYFVKDYDKARDSYNVVINDYPLPPEDAKPKEHDELYVDACETIGRTHWDEAEFYHKKAREYRYANPEFAIENIDKAAAKYEKASKAYARTLQEINARDMTLYKREGEEKTVYDKVNSLSSYGLVLKGDLLTMRADIDPTLAAPVIAETTEIDPVDIEPVIYDTAEKLDTLDDPHADLLVEAPPPISAAKRDAMVEAAKVYEENADANQGEEVGRLSLGKAAETYEQAQDFAEAGKTYQKYAVTYPDAEDSVMAWKKAAEMYELDEDYGKAAQVFMQINDNPKLKDTPMGEGEDAVSFGELALFQAGVCYQILGDYDTAAETYDRFNDEYQAHAIPRIKATYRQAKMYEKMGMKGGAIEPFTESVTLYKASQNMGIDVSSTDPFVAEAYFKLADEGFDEYDKLQLTMPQSVMEANLNKRLELSQQLIARYNDCADMGQPFWTVACHARTGDVYLSFRDALFNAGVPPEIDPSVWEHLPYEDPTRGQYEAVYYEYKGALDEQGYALEEQAINSYSEAIILAEGSGIYNDYYESAYEMMMIIRPTDVVKHEDVAANGLRSDNTWSVAADIEDTNWSRATYDDSAWGSTIVSTWREKDVVERTGIPAGDPSPIWDSMGTGTVFLRKKISATFPTELTASIQSRGNYEFYINGVMVGSNFDKNAWMSPDEYDVSSYLQPGDHVIAIKSKRSRNDSYGVMFSISPAGGFPGDTSLLTPVAYQCSSCDYIYDSAIEGVDLYETYPEWVCPDCGADKGSFIQIDDMMGDYDSGYDNGDTYGDTYGTDESYDTDDTYEAEDDYGIDDAPVLDEGTDTEGTTESESSSDTGSGTPEDETTEPVDTGDYYDDIDTTEDDYETSIDPSDTVDWMDDLPEDTGDGN